MKLFLLLFFSITIMMAKTITLKEILSQTKSKHPLFQAKEQIRLSLEAQSKANFASNPVELSLNGAHAKPNNANDDFEYSVGLSKTLPFGNTKALGLSAQRLQNEVALLQKEKTLLRLSNRIQNFYHQSCLDKENRLIIEASLQSYQTLYEKKKKAYKFHEISKKELLQLEMQMRTLKQKAKSSLSQEKISKERLYDLSLITKHQPLSCQDISPLIVQVSFDGIFFSLSQNAYTKELNALDKLEKRYNKNIDSINISSSYDDELDTKRFGVGIAVPLSFSSEKNEQMHLSILHQKELKKLEHINWIQEQVASKKELEGKLKNAYDTIIMIEENLAIYRNTLMPLIEKSFRYGESSSLEYIFGRQKLLELSQELIQTKKTYYQTLFKLYSLLETEI